MQRKVLNVGGHSKEYRISNHYQTFEHVMLDIDPKTDADIVCDARNLITLEKGGYDAIFNSHNLEHFHRHDALKVLKGFFHVLKDDGFAEIFVPDLMAVMQEVVTRGLDLESILYQSPAGPIMVNDVIYGLQKQVELSGVDFFAHKWGFSQKSLCAMLAQAGFKRIFYIQRGVSFEIGVIAFKQAEPTQEQREILKIREKVS